MFKTTFISATAAYLLTFFTFVALGITAGPNSSDLAFVIGYVIGVVGACAAIGALAGGIAVLLFRSQPVAA